MEGKDVFVQNDVSISHSMIDTMQISTVYS